MAKDAQFAGLSGVSNLMEFVAAILSQETPAAARASAWFEKRPQGGILADEMPLLQQALHHLEVRRCTCVSLVLVWCLQAWLPPEALLSQAACACVWATLSITCLAQGGELEKAREFSVRVSKASKEHQLCLAASTRLASVKLSFSAAAAGSSSEPVSAASSKSALAALLPCAWKAAPKQASAAASTGGSKACTLRPLAANAPRPPPPPPLKPQVHMGLQVLLLHLDACDCCQAAAT